MVIPTTSVGALRGQPGAQKVPGRKAARGCLKDRHMVGRILNKESV